MGATDGEDAVPVARRLADAAAEDGDGGGDDCGVAAPPSGRPRRDRAPASVAAAGRTDAVTDPAGGVADARRGWVRGVTPPPPAPHHGRRKQVDDQRPAKPDDGEAAAEPGKVPRAPTKPGRGALIMATEIKKKGHAKG